MSIKNKTTKVEIAISNLMEDWYSEYFYGGLENGVNQIASSFFNELSKDPAAINFRDKIQIHSLIIQSWGRLYSQTLSDLKGLFSYDELCLILDYHNGGFMIDVNPETLGVNVLPPEIVGLIGYEGGPRNWDVDPKEIIAKGIALSPIQSMCLEIWAKGFWGDVIDIEDADCFEEYVSQLMPHKNESVS